MDVSILLRAVAGIGFLLLASGAGWWTRRLPAASHRYGFAVAAATGVLGLTFVLESAYMATTGIETALTNIGYGITWMLVAAVLCAVAGAGKRLTLLVVSIAGGRFGLLLVSTYGMAFLGEAFVGILLLVALLGSLAVWIYLLQRPLSRAARAQVPERTLLATKLKYLAILAWVAHSASIGLFGAMIMIGLSADLTRIYLDVIIMLGIVGVTLRSPDALEATSDERPSLESEPTPAAEPAD